MSAESHGFTKFQWIFASCIMCFAICMKKYPKYYLSWYAWRCWCYHHVPFYISHWLHSPLLHLFTVESRYDTIWACFLSLHYNDVIMGTLASQPFIRAQIKENIKAPRHWPLCGKFTGTGEFPAQRVSNAENGPIWWRHHVTRSELRLCSANHRHARLLPVIGWA